VKKKFEIQLKEEKLSLIKKKHSYFNQSELSRKIKVFWNIKIIMDVLNMKRFSQKLKLKIYVMLIFCMQLLL